MSNNPTPAQLEEWRPVPGHPRYEVSDLGRVMSHHWRQPHILRAATVRGGYQSVALASPTGVKSRLVHQLVTEAFKGPRPSPAHDVRHLDGDPTNNRADNLQWGSRSENIYDAVEHGTHNNTRKTECPQGHPYDDENTYVLPSRPNARYCRECNRQSRRDMRRRAAAARAAGMGSAA